MSKIGPISRYTFIGGALTLVGLLIFAWMIQIQTSESAEDLRAMGQDYTYIRKTFFPERGNIYDRWGHLLAGNVEVYEIGVDLPSMKDPKTIAITLAEVAGLDYGTVYGLLTMEENPEHPRRYVVLANDLTPDMIGQIEAQEEQLAAQINQETNARKRATLPSLEGLLWSPRLQRSYPEKSLGSTILGFYSYKDPNQAKGYFGVEGKYDHLLAGSPVQVMVPADPYLISESPSIPPGISLVLTIDREIQAMAERVLDDAVADNDAESGTIIIMDPRNGELIAMATTPRLDPNEYWKYQEIFPNPIPFNRAVGQTYEPGSVFKVLTVAAGIDAGVITPDTPFLDTGVINVGGIPIYNWNRGAWGPQDITGCMQHSLNVCLAWIAQEIGPTTFYTYLQRFGIGHLTGIDLAGEVNWPLSVVGDPNWYPVNLGTNSFGQGVATTPIQMITSISAVANKEGKMMAPHVLKAVIENGEQYNNPPQVIGTPISGETARTVTDMLAISLEGESSDALVEGYRVAGKTGTAEIPGPGGYLTNLTNASFVGWGPVDDPQFIVYVWLEKPTSSQWGSVVAAPVFREVVENLVILLDLPPDAVRQQLASQQEISAR